MKNLQKSENASLYLQEDMSSENLKTFLLSTPETCSICNDPFLYGVKYTKALEASMVKLFKGLKDSGHEVGQEESSVVFNILRGGMNFYLRDALYEAYGWNKHKSAFISSQRAYDEEEGWYITENRYQKIPDMKEMNLIVADVVATGVSLEHALKKMIDISRAHHNKIKRITFITIGGKRAHEICERIDELCRSIWSDYISTNVVFIEGIFDVAGKDSDLSIALHGTDFLRTPMDLLTPEFIDSQQEEMSYPLERCTIYDAGSRAYDIKEYLDDICEYWGEVKKLAENGMTLSNYLMERYPADPRLNDAEWVSANDNAEALLKVAESQLAKEV